MPPEDPTPKDAQPTALLLAANRAAKADRSMPSDEREARVDQLVRMGALFLKADLSVGVMPHAQDLVRRSVPALLGLVDLTPKQQRSADLKAAEAVLGARWTASREQKRPNVQALVNEKLAAEEAADPALKGRSKDQRARARELMVDKVMNEQGIAVGALRFNGVS